MDESVVALRAHWMGGIAPRSQPVSNRKAASQGRSDDESSNQRRSWSFKYDLLLRYGEEHSGDCNVPLSHSCVLGNGRELWLGVWLNKQRQKMTATTLKPKRITALQQLVDEGRLSWSVEEY